MSRAGDKTKPASAARGVREARLDLDAFLPYRLNVLASTVSDSLSRVYAERFGIAVPEWRVLAALGQTPEMTARDIGLSTRMHKTKVSRAMAALDGKGLIARRAGADDRREAFAALTAKGRATYQALVPLALSFTQDLEAVLTSDERASLDRALAKLFARALHLAEALDNMER